MIYYLAALGAAFAWAISAIISANPSSALGSIAFVRIRMTMVFFMLAAVVLITGGWRTVEMSHITPTIISGLILFDGDAGLLDRLQDLRHVAAGVDYHGFLGRLVPDDGAILLEQRHRHDDCAGLRLSLGSGLGLLGHGRRMPIFSVAPRERFADRSFRAWCRRTIPE